MELRDYQKVGYQWLRKLLHLRAGAILADDMGLGKTLQILAVMVALRSEGPMLVVAPASVIGHWEDQITRFAPTLSPRRFDSEGRSALLSQLETGDVLLVTYGVLHRDIDALKKVEFRVAVLDEAQAIKNAKSQRARAAHQLNASGRIVSSGTPVENHLGEFWSLMQFANPGLLGSAESFEERFVEPLRRGERAAKDTLRQLVGPFLLRRTKSEVLSELPEKTEVTFTIEPTVEEQAFYEALRRKSLEEVSAAGHPGAGRMKLLTALMRLRQAARHPRLAGAPIQGTSSKHETLFALIDDLRQGGHRALIFSQIVEHLAIVRKLAEERGIEYEYLDGSTPIRAREDAVRRFQAGNAELFFISLRAGGSGLNLTGADYVIHLDPWWNPAVESQATDRVHRIGQKRPVTVYRLVTRGTVEEKILALHGEKRATAEVLLDGAAKASPLDLDVLRSLLA